MDHTVQMGKNWIFTLTSNKKFETILYVKKCCAVHSEHKLLQRTYPQYYGSNFVCKLMRYVQMFPMYASPFLLVAISADRYQVMIFALCLFCLFFVPFNRTYPLGSLINQQTMKSWKTKIR